MKYTKSVFYFLCFFGIHMYAADNINTVSTDFSKKDSLYVVGLTVATCFAYDCGKRLWKEEIAPRLFMQSRSQEKKLLIRQLVDASVEHGNKIANLENMLVNYQDLYSVPSANSKRLVKSRKNKK